MNRLGNAIAILLLLAATRCGVALAQDAPVDKIRGDLVSTWLVVVAGEANPLVLKVTDVKAKSAATFEVEAIFGFYRGRMQSVDGEFSVQGTERKLSFLTQSGNRYVAVQKSPDAFDAIFTNRRGEASPSRFERVTEEALVARVDAIKAENAARAEKLIVAPGANVPPACAAFVGQWTGSWTQGGIGQTWLWITEVDANCKAKIAYLGSDRVPQSFSSADIKDGRLAFLCNSSTGGTCYFERRGSQLWAGYTNPSGGGNSAVFERLN